MVLDGYVRVSEVKGRTGESFLSPVVQREQIERWTHAHGATLGIVFEELDQSGGKADRPMLNELLQRIEERRVDGVVVASFDRFGRSLVDNLAAIQRIHDAGATFVSLRERLDLTTDTGKLVLRIMLSMAEWELNRVRTRWNTARRRAVARGIHMGPYAPTGYQRDQEGRLRPDECAGPVITEMFLLRAHGATIGEVIQLLEDSDIRTPAGNRAWKPAAVHKVIQNRVYLGELHHGAISNPQAHPPLIDPITWNAAQKPRVMIHRPSRRLPTLLGGILRCAGCGTLMRSQTVTTRAGLRKRVYYCGRRFKAGECSSPAWISAAIAEPHLDEIFFTLAHRHRPPAPRTTTMRRLTLAHERATEELTTFRDTPAIRASIDHERFSEGLAERYARERLATLAIAAARSRTAAQGTPAKELERSWPTLSLDQRRALMGELIDCAFVFRRESGEERIFVCARGDAPVDLSQRGNRRRNLRPFDPAGTPQAQPGPRMTAWRSQRIAAELAAYLETCEPDSWPSDEEFVFAGRGPLLRQINHTGGPLRWSTATSLRRPRRHPLWTDARIRAALDVMLAGRTYWPTHPEFTALGLDGLYTVLARRGRREWAEEYGLKYRNTGGAAKRWTEPRVRETLARLCVGRDIYPSADDFAAAGLSGLYGAIARRHGGHDRWAAKVALPRHSWRNGGGGSDRATDEFVAL